MTNFWENLPKPFFILAPMESVTDIVFRHVIASAAKPDIFFTEFVNASSYCSEKGIDSTRGRLTFDEDEQPIVAQIWGNKPAQFAQMAAGLAQMGFAGIDINMGCPDKAVVKTGSGSALIKTPELAGELIQSAKSSGLPISVKTRIGDVSVDQWHDWIKYLLQQDVVNLTVHLRTRKEMSKVGAHYELIPEIKQLRDEIAPKTLLTINGDVTDRLHGEELAQQYGVDGIMIGRGVFTNPFAFEKVKHQPSRDELLALLNLHLDLYDKYSAAPLQGGTLQRTKTRKFDPLKRFFKIYIRDFPGASELRDKLMQSKSTDEVRKLINS
jgi:tRNA-dihydrouridine synthase